GVRSVNLGDLAAGASKPYSVSIPVGDRNLGAGVRYKAAPSWDRPSLDVAELSFSVTYSGSHVIDNVTGKVKNSGKGPAPNVSITFTESADKAGQSVLGATTTELASGAAKVGTLVPGARAPFSLTIDLGSSAAGDARWVRVTVAWEQTRFLILRESKSQSTREPVPVS